MPVGLLTSARCFFFFMKFNLKDIRAICKICRATFEFDSIESICNLAILYERTNACDSAALNRKKSIWKDISYSFFHILTVHHIYILNFHLYFC